MSKSDFLILYCKGTAKILYLQEKIKNIFRNYYLIDLNQFLAEIFYFVSNCQFCKFCAKNQKIKIKFCEKIKISEN